MQIAHANHTTGPNRSLGVNGTLFSSRFASCSLQRAMCSPMSPDKLCEQEKRSERSAMELSLKPTFLKTFSRLISFYQTIGLDQMNHKSTNQSLILVHVPSCTFDWTLCHGQFAWLVLLRLSAASWHNAFAPAVQRSRGVFQAGLWQPASHEITSSNFHRAIFPSFSLQDQRLLLKRLMHQRQEVYQLKLTPNFFIRLLMSVVVVADVPVRVVGVVVLPVPFDTGVCAHRRKFPWARRLGVLHVSEYANAEDDLTTGNRVSERCHGFGALF